MTQKLTAATIPTATEICKAAEAAAPGRVTYDLVRAKQITITSADGERRVSIGLTDDLDGGDCWLSVRSCLVEDRGQSYWLDDPSDSIDTLDDVRTVIGAL